MRTSFGSDAPLVVPLLTEPSDRPVADQRFVDHKHYPESVTKNYAKPGRRRKAAGSAVKRLNGLIKYWADAAQIITGSRQDTEFGRDLLACETLRRKASIAAAVAGAVWLRKERGRDERSCKSPTPSARNHLTHLMTVFGAILNWRACRLRQPAIHHGAP